MMTTKKLITSDDPKGRQATDLFRGVYNKAQLTDEQAQRLNENREGEFTAELLQLVQKYSNMNKYIKEEVYTECTYPSEYKGPKPIVEQIKTIATIFEVDPKEALEFIKTLPALPDGAEGWFAVPKVSAVGKKHSPAITDKDEQYCDALRLTYEELYNRNGFDYDWRAFVHPKWRRIHKRTASFLEKLESEQQGDILIIAAQYGMRHRGRSVRRAMETFSSNEFDLGAFAVGCMTLVHPERYVRLGDLRTFCAGDQICAHAHDLFSGIPILRHDGHHLKFEGDSDNKKSPFCGSASAFLPQ